MNRAKIIERYSVDVIDIEMERLQIEFKHAQSLEALGVEGAQTEVLERLASERDSALAELDMYLPFEESSSPTDIGELDSVVPYYVEKGGAVFQCWEVVVDDPALLLAEIERLKAELSSTDYQIIKCHEYAITGSEPPYDIRTLHSSRQALRNKINALECKLNP